MTSKTQRKRPEARDVVSVPPKGDYAKELKALRELAAKPARTDRPTAVPLNEIRECTAVFQPRSADARGGSMSDRHIRELARVIRATEGGDLDPVLVMPLGSRWQLIEGHHRVAAYKTEKRTSPIPVEIFEGSLEEAIAQSVGRNSRNKLPMQLKDRREAAWKLINLSKVDADGVFVYAFSAPRTAELSGMSVRTVKHMRAVKKHIQGLRAPSGDPQYTDEQIQAMAYWQAEKLFNGDEAGAVAPDYDLEKAVADFVTRLERTFGKSWASQAEAFALALLASSENGAGLVNSHLNEELGTEAPEDAAEGPQPSTPRELEDRLIDHLEGADAAFLKRVHEAMHDGLEF